VRAAVLREVSPLQTLPQELKADLMLAVRSFSKLSELLEAF